LPCDEYVAPAPVYVAPPPPVVYQPAPVHYRPAPWTPEWYTYCSARYRSFDPATGTFLAFDGRPQFCR
jgi:hypothetical protein